MGDERAIAARARQAARRLTAGRRGGAVGAAVDAARSVYGRVERRRDDEPADAAAGDAELARLRAELNAELERLAARRN